MTTTKADIYEPLSMRHFSFTGIENPGSASPVTFAEGLVPSRMEGIPGLRFTFRSPASAEAMGKPVAQSLAQDVLLAVAAQEGLAVAS